MTEPTKLTVNLTSQAAEALADLAERTGHSRTDMVNRSIQTYDQILAVRDTGRDVRLSFDETDGLDVIVCRRREGS